MVIEDDIIEESTEVVPLEATILLEDVGIFTTGGNIATASINIIDDDGKLANHNSGQDVSYVQTIARHRNRWMDQHMQILGE